MNTSLIIAKNTFREVIRDRILYGLFAFGILFILLSLLLGTLSFAEQARIVTNLGLAAAELTAVVISIFVGSTLVSREIEKQTILTLLSRPISRTAFLVGKFLGLSLVVAISVIVMSSVLGVLLKFYGQAEWTAFLYASTGILLESLVLIAFTVFFGSFARPVLTVIFSLSLWFIGHGTSDIAYFSSKSDNPMFQKSGFYLSRILPNLDAFNWRSQVVYGDIVSGHELFSALLLCCAWIFIAMVLASIIFSKRDFI